MLFHSSYANCHSKMRSKRKKCLKVSADGFFFYILNEVLPVNWAANAFFLLETVFVIHFRSYLDRIVYHVPIFLHI